MRNQYFVAMIAVVALMNGASHSPGADEPLLLNPQPANSSTLADKTAVIKGDWRRPAQATPPLGCKP